MGFISGLLGAKNDFQSNPWYMDWDKTGMGAQQGIGSATGGPFQGAIQGALGQSPNFGQAAGQGLGMVGQANQGLGGLVSQLQQQATGQGPSLAQSQLQQATDRNANMAAGALASQRGINPALAARMITQQQANANQQAAGQSADLRMQEQMAANQQLAGVLGQQMQGGLGMFGQAGGLGNQFLGTVGQLGQGQQELSQKDYLSGYQRMLEGAMANQRQQMSADQINAGVQGQNAQTNGGIAGGILGGAAGALGLAKGGQVPQTASGGLAGAFAGMGSTPGFNSGLVALGQALRQKMQAHQAAQPPAPIMAQPGTFGIADALQGSSMAHPMMGGGEVPGTPEVQGDSEQNDKVPAMLSPGEIVIPRSKTKDPDQAKAFVEAIAKHEGTEDEPEGYSAVLKKIRELETHVKKMAGGGKA